MNLRHVTLACSLGLLTALAGCTSIGPRSVAVDRFDYSTSLAESWKQQTLLNIVKIRYVDLPVFVDVASVVAGYSLQTGVSVGGVVSSEHAVQGNYGSATAQGIYTDRPTITYTPLTGERFMHGLITPIDPRKLFFMLQTGYPADFLLGLTVESLNGVRNRTTLGGVVRPADPDFLRAMQLLREVQFAGGMGMRVEESKDKSSTAVLFFRSADVPQETLQKVDEIRRLLRLAPGEQKFVLEYSPVQGAPNVLTVNSRSMLQILQAFASYVEVPEEHLAAHLTMPAFERSADGENARIHSGRSRPENAFAAVRYKGYWFWVDDSDFATKRALTAIMFFFSLAETGGAEKLPLITIPAQ